MVLTLKGLPRFPARSTQIIRNISQSKFTPRKLSSSVPITRSLHNLNLLSAQFNKNLFSTLSARRQTFRNDTPVNVPQPPLKDPSHPSLFYHLFFTSEASKEPVFALSFLETRPPSVRSQTVIGWLPAAAEGGEDESGLNDFVENTRFLSLLHKAVKSGLLEDDIWVNGAIQTHAGWMHIFDQRNIPALGRIPDPDDILASVRVEDGKMLIETYQPMPTYRLCTGDGVLQLSDGISKKLKEVLDRATKEETN